MAFCLRFADIGMRSCRASRAEESRLGNGECARDRDRRAALLRLRGHAAYVTQY